MIMFLMIGACSDDEDNNPVVTPDPIVAPTFVATWGTQGSGDGQFENPYGLDCDNSGNVYVADTGNQRIQKFSSDGTFLTKWGSAGQGAGQFNNPVGIACDDGDNVYVTDRFNHRVQVFTGDGTFIREWGTQGSGDAEFDDPLGIDCDNTGKVFVVDGGSNDDVKIFTDDGSFIRKAEMQAYGVIWNGLGDFYAAQGYRIRRFGMLDCVQVSVFGSLGSDDGQLADVTMLEYDVGNEIIYVVDRGNSRIQMFAPDGTFVDNWGQAGSGDEEFDWPVGIARDLDGNVFVTDTGNNRIQKFQ